MSFSLIDLLKSAAIGALSWSRILALTRHFFFLYSNANFESERYQLKGRNRKKKQEQKRGRKECTSEVGRMYFARKISQCSGFFCDDVRMRHTAPATNVQERSSTFLCMFNVRQKLWEYYCSPQLSFSFQRRAHPAVF